MSKGIARLRYDATEDRMVLEVKGKEDKEWGFCRSAKFHKLHEDDEEAGMISFTIFKEWYNWSQNNGYELDWE